MHLAHGTADCNRRASQRLYAQPYSRGQTSSNAFSTRLHQRLSGSGYFIVDIHEREKIARMPNNERTVLDLVQSNLGTRMWTIANHVWISHMTVWWILCTKDVLLYHPDMYPYCLFNALFS
ncbi:DUF4817 domain-containing protein [Trichonephila clavipes]|nr:DUF4817 domain-containing protein [Trichonephila clavipes]